MARGNEELIRNAYDALQRNDIDAFVEFVHPEMEWHPLVLEMEGTFRGREGVQEFWRLLRESFPDWRPELVDVEDLGDWAVIHSRGAGSGAASGLDIGGEFWQAVKMRDRLAIEYHAVRSKDEALRIAEGAG
jgi:ketosteroid isomerase-like protein